MGHTRNCTSVSQVYVCNLTLGHLRMGNDIVRLP